MKIYKIFLLFLIVNSLSDFLFGEEFYRSNSIGMVFENIPSFRLDEFDWVLKITGENDTETRVLYYRKTEKERTDYIQDEQALVVRRFVNDIPVSEEKIVDGLLIEEIKYSKTDPTAKYLYSWDSGQLEKVSYFSDENHIYDDIYIKQNNGRLKQVRRIYSEKEILSAGYIYSDNQLHTEWFDSGNKAYLYRYSGDKVYRIENWLDDKVVRTVNFSANDHVKVVVEKDLLTGDEIRKTFDMDDRLLTEIRYLSEGISKFEYRYEGSSLIEKKVAASGLREKYLYFYSATDILEKEILFVNGILQKETIYSSGEKVEEKLYKNNNLLLKVFYVNGEKSGEERF